MQWSAQAPANIALIKYMGKKDSFTNYPANPSLSYTLPELQSHVTLTASSEKEDTWEPLQAPHLIHPIFSSPAQTRFLKHLAFIKRQFNYEGSFKVQSANTFPHGTGLASSASSFAALTQCAVRACAELTNTAVPTVSIQAELSRQGSGSSCRSFFAPWALWETQTAAAIELPYKSLLHQVILINTHEKKVSSSEAHQRIQTSTNYADRPMRAKAHLNALIKALQNQQWDEAYHICWEEFQDMHALFHTAAPSFSYITPEANLALQHIQNKWQHMGDGPLVTMDAGPNIHLLYRPEQIELAEQLKQDFIGKYNVL